MFQLDNYDWGKFSSPVPCKWLQLLEVGVSLTVFLNTHFHKSPTETPSWGNFIAISCETGWVAEHIGYLGLDGFWSKNEKNTISSPPTQALVSIWNVSVASARLK